MELPPSCTCLSATSSRIGVFREEPDNGYLFLFSYDFFKFLVWVPICFTVSRAPSLTVPVPLDHCPIPSRGAPQGMEREEPPACGLKEGPGSAPSPISATPGASAAFTWPDLRPHEL